MSVKELVEFFFGSFFHWLGLLIMMALVFPCTAFAIASLANFRLFTISSSKRVRFPKLPKKPEVQH